MRVRAASVNAADWHLTEGRPRIVGMLLPGLRNHARGLDVASHVEAVVAHGVALPALVARGASGAELEARVVRARPAPGAARPAPAKQGASPVKQKAQIGAAWRSAAKRRTSPTPVAQYRATPKPRKAARRRG